MFDSAGRDSNVATVMLIGLYWQNRPRKILESVDVSLWVLPPFVDVMWALSVRLDAKNWGENPRIRQPRFTHSSGALGAPPTKRSLGVCNLMTLSMSGHGYSKLVVSQREVDARDTAE